VRLEERDVNRTRTARHGVVPRSCADRAERNVAVADQHLDRIAVERTGGRERYEQRVFRQDVVDGSPDRLHVVVGTRQAALRERARHRRRHGTGQHRNHGKDDGGLDDAEAVIM
jgi:hypothetical protein